MTWLERLLGYKRASKEELVERGRRLVEQERRDDPQPFVLALAADLRRQLAGATVKHEVEEESVEVR